MEMYKLKKYIINAVEAAKDWITLKDLLSLYLAIAKDRSATIARKKQVEAFMWWNSRDQYKRSQIIREEYKKWKKEQKKIKT